jgi:hypothetical protein
VDSTEVYLEVGLKRTFAGALDWPGWCRSAAGEDAALAALVEYASRYAGILSSTDLDFTPPDDPALLVVVERIRGNSTTDFGAPGLAPARDNAPFDAAECGRSQTILAAIWTAFDRVVREAGGRELRKGPRGGGRDRDRIVRHVLGADAGYLRSLGQKFKQHDQAPPDKELERTRAAIRDALLAGERGEIPQRGPRGGALWTPRYFVRRLAWHALDHVWEIEDRLV